MASAVYILCAIAALGCAGMLLRAWRRNPTRLLLWSSGCFAALALNSILVVLDEIVLPGSDLRLLRLGVASAGLLLLVWALVTGPGEGDAHD